MPLKQKEKKNKDNKMAKSEILMWVAGIMMMIILGLVVAPSITSSGILAKGAVAYSEVENIRKSAVLLMANSGSMNTCDLVGKEQEIADNLGLKIESGRIVSKIPNIRYIVGCASSENLRIIVQEISDLEIKKKIFNSTFDSLLDSSKTYGANTNSNNSLELDFKSF